MAETTGISWCRSTFNPWVGCTEISPGCDHCYARELDKRHRWGGTTHWGTGVPRYRTSPANWRVVRLWNRKAEQIGGRWLVFCASLADVFDNEVPEEWRTDLFRMIATTPALTWLVLTKRIGNAQTMLHQMLIDAPPLPNIWLGASVVNQEEADRDIPKLLATPAVKRFVSYEPALGPINFQTHMASNGRLVSHLPILERGRGGVIQRGGVDWIIVGGESNQGGAKARPFDLAWARQTVAQCKAAGVACFVKQLGSDPRCVQERWSVRGGGTLIEVGVDWTFRKPFKDRAGADPAEWPADLRLQCFPE